MSSGDEAILLATAGSEERMGVKNARDTLEQKVLEEEVLVGEYGAKTRLLQLINGGSFGQIFLGEDQTSHRKVAVKIEHPGQIEQLLYEGQVYRKLTGGPGIPSVSWYGMHGSMFNVMVMELLGPSLQELFVEADRKFSLKTVLMLADQMFDTLNFMHRQGFVHRDISSNNFLMGLGENSHRLYLVDFGLAKKFNASPGFLTGHRSMFKFARPMVGTARFCSTFCHRGEEEACRGDMESIGFLLLYLLNGRLPWQGIQAQSHDEKIDRIFAIKTNTSLAEMCEGLPEEFLTYTTFVRGMGQYDLPNYSEIRIMFRELAKREQIEYDYLYDWCQMRTELERNASVISSSTDEDERDSNFLAVRTMSNSTSDSNPSSGTISN